MLKKAVIDIDNTLWHFCEVLYKRLIKINKTIPSPEYWVEWDFWEDYCSKEEFLKAIKTIHVNQDDERHLPYPEARDFLSTLKEHGFYIIIASHRSPDTLEQTERWLKRHKLLFDEIHLSYNKTVLIDTKCYVVVDDAPDILEKAANMHILASGLRFPWNDNYNNNGYQLFHSLNDILGYILKRTNCHY
jgi:hypothetical protein